MSRFKFQTLRMPCCHWPLVAIMCYHGTNHWHARSAFALCCIRLRAILLRLLEYLMCHQTSSFLLPHIWFLLIPCAIRHLKWLRIQQKVGFLSKLVSRERERKVRKGRRGRSEVHSSIASCSVLRDGEEGKKEEPYEGRQTEKAKRITGRPIQPWVQAHTF